MNPEGGSDAIGLGRGELLWHSNDAARPVAAGADVLVAQAESRTPTNQLQLRTLDPRTGRRRLAATHTLPAGTRATVVDTHEGEFNLRGRATSAEATLSWEFVSRPLQGVNPGALDIINPPTERVDKPAQRAAAALPSNSGVIRIDLTSGRASDVSGQAGFERGRTADVPIEQRLPSVTGEQFSSVDGRHVMTSERIADDSVWEKYQWTVFERQSGRRLGTLRDYRSHAPFIVVGSSILYETGPFERRTDREVVSEPLRLRAVDLTKGVLLWSRQIRDTKYRGTLPG